MSVDKFEPMTEYCLDILSEGMWQFKDPGPDSEQFDVIPELPKPWREWRRNADEINMEIRRLAAKAQELATWAPSFDIEHDEDRQETCVTVRVPNSTIKYAKDKRVMLRLIGEQCRWEFSRYLADHGQMPDQTKPIEGNP